MVTHTHTYTHSNSHTHLRTHTHTLIHLHNPTHTHNSKFDIEEQKKGFASPIGIAVDGAKDGFLYVADSNNHRIKWFKKNGDYAYQGTQGKAKEHASNGQRGDGDGEFQSVFGIAVDPSNCGHVYVADTWNERLQIFTKAMQLIRIIGKADHHGCGQDGALRHEFEQACLGGRHVHDVCMCTPRPAIATPA